MDEISPDALVNNALSVPIAKTHFHRTGMEVFRQGFNYNILPTVEITQKAISGFRKKKGGRIITLLTATLVGKPPGRVFGIYGRQGVPPFTGKILGG